MSLPTDSAAREAMPIATGCLDFFPDAIAEIARLSLIANEQHNPGQPLRWDRSKSPDDANKLIRHFMQRGAIDRDTARHTAKVAWRALAMLQKEIELATQQPNIPHTATNHLSTTQIKDPI